MAEQKVNYSVLYVDDEKGFLELAKDFMERANSSLKVDTVSSANKAIEAIKHKNFDGIISDFSMPEMNGLELLRSVKKDYPHIIRMVLSGYTQVTTLLTAINQGEIFRFVTKPWKLEEEFKPSVREAVEYYDFQKERARLADKEGQHESEHREKVLERSE